MIQLTDLEFYTLSDKTQPAFALAMRIILETAKILDAPKLVPITSAHIYGCLYHGDSEVYFAELLVLLGAKVSVPTNLNVGALDLIHPDMFKFNSHSHTMAKRQMQAYLAMNCQATLIIDLELVPQTLKLTESFTTFWDHG